MPAKRGRKAELYKYEINDEILCKHGPCIHKAKILKRIVFVQDQQPSYFVRYHGWNSQWDEWVSGDRCLPNTEENIAKMQKINKQIEKIQSNTKRIIQTQTHQQIIRVQQKTRKYRRSQRIQMLQNFPNLHILYL